MRTDKEGMPFAQERRVLAFVPKHKAGPWGKRGQPWLLEAKRGVHADIGILVSCDSLSHQLQHQLP
jgi:hypothetical protein